MMSNDLLSVQNQIQNVIQVHHGGGGHGKSSNKMPFVASEAEKATKAKPKKPFQSEMATKLAINPDADSKQQQQQQQQQNEEFSQEQNKAEAAAEKDFGLATLELIGQSNRIMISTLDQLKKYDQE